ncbi:MAG: NAD(+) synthase [Butyricicoccus sp.]|nr:NAD(+) synthase [Butyricicoccus sp.]
MKDGFICVAAGTPKIKVADCRFNAGQIIDMMRDADRQGVKILALPELCMTGYTCGDLFLQDSLLDAAEEGLRTVLEATAELEILTALGMPVRAGGKLYNCAVAVQKGEILSVVPKTYLPNYGEFYEARWFCSGSGARTDGGAVLGSWYGVWSCLIDCPDMPGLRVGIELCEDLWASDPPSRRLAEAGCTLILNLSASNEVVGKADYRRQLVTGQSGRLCCGYVYADAGEGESTTDLVFTGHNMIAENGALLCERRFSMGLTVSEIDVQRLIFERRRLTSFPAVDTADFSRSEAGFTPCVTELTRDVSPTPFIPEDIGERDARCEEILTIQALGLKKRLEHTGAGSAVIGISGGLDSCLALLVTVRAFDMLRCDRRGITAVTMPCFGTTARTRSNAEKLCELLGVTLRTVEIGEAVALHFRDIGHDAEKRDVTYENAQARERTQVIMDIANELGGLVVGTGDLSELALGWCTYNGDHMSMYGVNAGVPKTLVRYIVRYEAGRAGGELGAVLLDIVDTPVSPELLPAKDDGEIAQRTEELVGPYELHDFFLYYMLRFGFGPGKLFRLARCAFGEEYGADTVKHWLGVFVRRFFSQQFKRSCMPDGPKVGSVSLSPRGDWRMPSDAAARVWLDEAESL